LYYFFAAAAAIMNYQPATQILPMTRKTRYVNTPFEVDEDDDSTCSFDTSSSNRSYLVLDFEEGEVSPCATECGYGIFHPEEHRNEKESLWYDDNDADDSNSDLYDDISLFTERLPSMTHSTHSLSGEEDTDGIQTPTSGDEDALKDVEDDVEDGLITRKVDFDYDQAAIDELRESLTRHLPSTSTGSAYFKLMVGEALSSLDEALRDAPVDCFEELCWESHCSSSPPPLDGVSRDHPSNDSRRTSKLVRFAPTENRMDVPEDALSPFEPDWDSVCMEELGYKFTIVSPSQYIGFSPRSTVNKRDSATSTGFKRFAKHLRLSH